MSNLKLKVGVLVAMLFVVGAFSAEAQHTYKFRDSLGVYDVKFTPHSPDTKFAKSLAKPLAPGTHEVRLSTMWGSAGRYGYNTINNEIFFIGDMDLESCYFGPSHYYALSLSYGYWFNEWFSLSGDAKWVYGHRNIFDIYTQAKVLTLRENDFSIMPKARFAWYRRGIVQLYSTIGLGVGVLHRERHLEGYGDLIDAYCAFDIKPFGIAVGRKWFGFAEVGYGASGVINVGVGYRINTKTR